MYDKILLIEKIGASMLRNPLHIKYHKYSHKNKYFKKGDWLGFHIFNDSKNYHEIEVTILDNNRGIYETLAHEICHAITEENNPKAKCHGPTFKKNCAKFRKILREWKIDLKPLFIPGIDL